MTRPAALASALILAALLTPETTPAEAAPSHRTEVTLYHWWSSPSERAAVEALGALFQKEHPDAAFVAREARAHGGGGRMFQVVSAAAGGGRAPEAFQVHAGAPLRPYLDAGLVSPVDDVWQVAGLVTAVPKVIRDMSTLDGRYHALPINVHRNNLVWYNKSVLDQHRIDPAAALAGWDAFFRAADQLRAAGMAAPVQIGEGWTASVAFESILAGRGVSAYEDWINGRLTASDDPRLLEAFAILRQLYGYANADHARTPWDAAIRRVISGEAAFCIMGDWANGEFRLAGKEFGRDYGALPVPGTKGLYGVSVDSFATSRGLADPASANRFLRFAAGRGAQGAFNAAKGSISARLDADLTRYDRYQKSAFVDFKSARVIYPNLTSAAHDAFKTSVDQVMVRFARDLDVQKAAAAVATSAAESKGKFTRTWSLE